MFASEYYKEAGCAPDIMTFAKSVAGGLPLSGVVAAKTIVDKVPAGTIGGTYNGNAVACAAALKLLEIMQRDDYPGKAMKISRTCMKRFNDWKKKYKVIGDVRGTGAMMGIEFIKGGADKTPNAAIVGKIVAAAWERGLILESAGTYGNVVRFLCPLCVTDKQLKAGLDIFEAVIKASM
jgi:4-aminobutyrate aminotransferase/(S)-3-amino-2-methylpropionate transaminase